MGKDPAQRDLGARTVALARRWVRESAAGEVTPAASRLAGVLSDPDGLPFTVGFIDGVIRPESLSAAATRLRRIAPLTPGFLPWPLRTAVRLGGALGPLLPGLVIPVARRALREMVGHLVVDARPDKLGPALGRLRESGAKLNLNLLGEAVLGEAEAQRRLAGIQELVERPDVDYVSVKVSAVASHLSLWAFDETVAGLVERLRPLYLTAAAHGTFLNLDMEEYRDLGLTLAVFRGLLSDPLLQQVEAGIALQAYLPDTVPVLQRLTEWAQRRVEAGGARIKVRLVKGANLAMERVDAILHGWSPAPYDTKVDTDANYLRCLDYALWPEHARAVRVGIAGHNLFTIAYAWLLAGERGVRSDIEFEMLLGMAQGQAAAVSREVGPVLLYVPVVRPAEFDVAISYLVRRLDEGASPENFLSAVFGLAEDPALFDRERDRFLAALGRMVDPGLRTGPNRTQNRFAAPSPAGETPVVVPPRSPETSVVVPPRSRETPSAAVKTPLHQGFQEGSRGLTEVGVADGGFTNACDTDPALPVNRAWARGILERVAVGSELGTATIAAARIENDAALDIVLQRVQSTARAWGARPAAERSAVLKAAAAALEARRADLIEIAAAETGKVLAEADPEVSEAVDFARYYATTALELDQVAGAVFVPAQVTVVTPPWNFPIAIPAGGVLAALAAGSGVVFKPAPQARRCAAVIAEALWQDLDAAGVPRDLLTLVDLDEEVLGRTLITHPLVDQVILTGSWETAALFRSWRPELRLLAETSGKNAIIVMPSADMDLAAADVVKSAFSHAGQKCSAASLVIVVGPVGQSQRFLRQLVDATTSLRVGPPEDPLTEIGPVISVPTGKLAWALTTLDSGEQWLVEPREIGAGDYAGRLWTPGIRTGVQPGSRCHLEEFFGPVLGVMSANSLEQAIAWQNAVAYGLTAGLATQDPADLAAWLEQVEAGNLYVNRGITGAIVRRQPFGGWKRSAVGPGAKAGGPNYLSALGSWCTDEGAPRGQGDLVGPGGVGGTALGQLASLAGSVGGQAHLRPYGRAPHTTRTNSRILALLRAAESVLDETDYDWLRQAAGSDAEAWASEFGQVTDVSGLGIERNLFRYRPAPEVVVRATADASWRDVLRTVLAGIRAGGTFTLSVPDKVPQRGRLLLADQGIAVFVDSDTHWVHRFAHPARRPRRVRSVGSREVTVALRQALAEAVGGDPDVAIYDHEVTVAGRLELLPFVREQAIAITAHRFGNPAPWSDGVL